MDESRLSGRIEMMARAGTMLLAAVYASGFVIVTLHQARFGISAFDLLKPKIFAAGFTFSALAFLASLVAFRFFRIGWWQGSRLSTQDAKNRTLDLIFDGVYFFLACEGAAFVFPFLFERTVLDTISGAALMWAMSPMLAAAVIVLGVLWLGWNRHFELITRFILLVGLAGSTAWIASLLNSRDRPALSLCIWFFGTGIGSVLLHGVLSTTEKRLRIEWERATALAFAVVAFYTGLVYPHIRSALGGGVPVQVVLYFNAQQPLFAGQILETNLLEENEHGYYVTPAIDGPRAYFIPRESVAFVKFERPGIR